MSMNISGSDYTSVEDLEAANGYDWCQTICDDLKVKATVPKNCPNLQYKDAYFFDGVLSRQSGLWICVAQWNTLVERVY